MSIKSVQRVLFPVLYPFAVLYGLGARLRNWLFEINFLKSVQFEPTVICVGNLAAGGTGKTPFVRFLIELLQDDLSLAVLSRGYNRKSKGFVLANNDTSVLDIGDEPMMYWYHYKQKVKVAVGEDRVLAIPQILSESDCNAIILDDAYQHRYVKPKFSVLLTDYNNLFINDFILPCGVLREPRKEANRSSVIIVSKCPSDISDKEMNNIVEGIKKYSPSVPVFFATIQYLKEVGVEINNRPIIIFSGLAHNKPFQTALKEKYRVLDKLEFSDHHWYTDKDIKKLQEIYIKFESQNPVIVTTEKDFMRLQTNNLKEIIKELPLCYIPIKVSFIKDETVFVDELNKMILA